MSAGHHHHALSVEGLTRLDSPIHHLPAGVKFFAAVAMVIATVTVPLQPRIALIYFPAAGLLLLGVAGLSLLRPSYLLRRLLMVEPIVIGVALLAFFQPHGGRVFVILLTRSTLCVFALLLLSCTTPFTQLLAVLRRLRAPAILVTTIALMYRYLFVLVEESQRMRRARASRTFTKSRWGTWRMLSTLLGQLFIRTGDRAERIYAAMCARGWT